MYHRRGHGRLRILLSQYNEHHTVTMYNGQSTSNPINYTLMGHPYGVDNPVSGTGTVLCYIGYGQQRTIPILRWPMSRAPM